MQGIFLLLPLSLLLASSVSCQLQCGATSRQKRIVIRQPTTQLGQLDHCQYNIAPWSSQVCQVRIDFERFELPQPAFNASSLQLECVDYLQLRRFKLCGRNSGQHLYLPLLRGQLLQLLFNLSSRSTQSTWQLTLTQLDCPRESLAVVQKVSLLPTVRPLLPFFGGLKRTFNLFNGNSGGGPATPLLDTLTGSSAADFELLAPLGCDQYYRSLSGGIVSFNYPAGIYMPNMKYSICVRSTGQSEISYRIDHFAMSKAESETAQGYDADCHSTVRTLGRSLDYLLIPNSQLANNGALQPTYYCGSGLAGSTLLAREPFIIHFSSDGQTNASESGFQLTYSVKQQPQMEL